MDWKILGQSLSFYEYFILQIFNAKTGDVAYAPKETPHHFSILTDTAKAILLITPAGFETFFKEFSMCRARL